MPDNPFENKAKQKLDELKFTPSDAVWQKVEAQIKKDRDRRRLVLWIPLCTLLLGALTYYFVSGSFSHPVNRTSGLSVSIPAKTGSSVGRPSDLPKSGSQASGSGKEDEGSSGKEVSGKKAKASAAFVGPGKEQTLSPAQKENTEIYAVHTNREDRQKAGKERTLTERPDASLTGPALASNEKERKITEDSEQRENREAMTDRNRQSISSGGKPAVNGAMDAAGKDPVTVNNKKTPDNRPTAPGDAVVQKKSAVETATGKSPKITDGKKQRTEKKHGLQWGLSGSGGLSSAFNRLIPPANAFYYYNAPAGAITSNPYFPTLPSEKQSVSFSFGLHVEKQLNKTTSVFTGLQYRYASISIARGYLVNQPLTITAANNSAFGIYGYYFGARNSGYNYTDRYHFIEIPFGIEQRLGQKSRFSVNAAISISRLFATNAMQYDAIAGIYFRDNSFLNRTQWNILGGLQYRLLQKGRYSLKAGPQAEYGLSNMLNNKSVFSKHLFYGGIQLLLVRNGK